jgi:hypothetical protein
MQKTVSDYNYPTNTLDSNRQSNNTGTSGILHPDVKTHPSISMYLTGSLGKVLVPLFFNGFEVRLKSRKYSFLAVGSPGYWSMGISFLTIALLERSQASQPEALKARRIGYHIAECE